MIHTMDNEDIQKAALKAIGGRTLREASVALNIHYTLLSMLSSGARKSASNNTLKKLGIIKVNKVRKLK